MTILDRIIANKKIELSIKLNLFPINFLEKSLIFDKPTKSLVKILKSSNSGIIAEHKRRSPSKQNINNSLSVVDVVKGYGSSGACGISILTDMKYFGGSIEDLILARASSKLPLLRKDFIINEYQIIEAKAYGADVILLISSVLSQNEIRNLSLFAKSLNLEVLVEVHDLSELNKSVMPSIDILGVNNRNLKTFEVNLDNSRKLAEKIPDEFLKISESGINNPKSIKDLKKHGYKGFLVGENFMKRNNPGETAFKFIKKIEDEI